LTAPSLEPSLPSPLIYRVTSGISHPIPPCTCLQTFTHQEGRHASICTRKPIHRRRSSVATAYEPFCVTPASGSSPVPGRLGMVREVEVIYERRDIEIALLPAAREAGTPRMARTDVCKHSRRSRRHRVMGKDLLACSAILRRWQYPSCVRAG
jgi:hypothetical protein